MSAPRNGEAAPVVETEAAAENQQAPDESPRTCRCFSVPNTCGCLDQYLIPTLRSQKVLGASECVAEFVEGGSEGLDSLAQSIVLNLQLPDGVRGRVVLDLRAADQSAGAGPTQGHDLIVDVLCYGNINHENSPSVGAAQTGHGPGVLKPTVGDATDTAAASPAAPRVSGLQDGAAVPPITAASTPGGGAASSPKRAASPSPAMASFPVAWS